MSDLVSETAPKGPGAIAFAWWRKNIDDSDGENKKARGIAARLRRATPLEVLCERSVHDLRHDLRKRGYLGDDSAGVDRLIGLVQILAHVRYHSKSLTFFQVVGEKPVNERKADRAILSEIRFQTLLRAEGEDFHNRLRRAVIMADKAAFDVEDLAFSIIFADKPAIRKTWCFHYLDTDAPAFNIQEISQ